MKSARSLILTTIVGAAALSAPAAPHAGTVPTRQRAEAASHGSHLQELPTLSRPHPARQVQQVLCNASSPTLGSNLCVWSFDEIPAGHVLQIDKLNCTGSAGAFLYNTQMKFQAPFLLGVLTAPFPSTYVTSAIGPYYFRAGETPIIAGIGFNSSTTGICSISGTLWKAAASTSAIVMPDN